MIIPLNGADPAGLAKVLNPRGNPPRPIRTIRMPPRQSSRCNRRRRLLAMQCFFHGIGLEKMKTPSRSRGRI